MGYQSNPRAGFQLRTSWTHQKLPRHMADYLEVMVLAMLRSFDLRTLGYNLPGDPFHGQ